MAVKQEQWYSFAPISWSGWWTISGGQYQLPANISLEQPLETRTARRGESQCGNRKWRPINHNTVQSYSTIISYGTAIAQTKQFKWQTVLVEHQLPPV